MSGLTLVLRPTTHLAASVLILALGGPAQAIPFVINNGSAPPNPANVIDHLIYGDVGDALLIRNVGCPPGWPAVSPDGPCPSPGGATAVEVVSGGSVYRLDTYDTSTVAVDGGSVGRLYAYDSSTFTMSGGVVEYGLYAQHSSTITMSGGVVQGDLEAHYFASITMSDGVVWDDLAASETSNIMMSGGNVGGNLFASDFSTITMSGGNVGHDLVSRYFSTVTMSGGTLGDFLMAYESSTIILKGSDFMVDGVPVPYGDLAALTGTLTGTLEFGDSLNNMFFQGGYAGSVNGTIRLVPEPSTSLLLAFGLMALAAGRRRRITSPVSLR